MLTADAASDTEAAALFADLTAAPALVLAVSGGPDSTALLILMSRWRAQLTLGPRMVAVTVDHQLRPQAAAEAAAVRQLADALGVEHKVLHWDGPKPRSGLQAAARTARYRLLAQEAARIGASHILTAHTLDDQAETVLFRLARGSGIGGLAAMPRLGPVSAARQLAPGAGTIMLARPFLGVEKARLIATCADAGAAVADDPSNSDPRFARARLRRLLPVLAEEGMTAARLSRLAIRAARADAALDWAVETALRELPRSAEGGQGFELPLGAFLSWPDEIALRVLTRAIEGCADRQVELGKLEALILALRTACGEGASRWRRTLAGALVSVGAGRLAIERAPPRRGALAQPASSGTAQNSFTSPLHQETRKCPAVPLAACRLGHTLPTGTTPGRHPQGHARAGDGRGIAFPLKGSG